MTTPTTPPPPMTQRRRLGLQARWTAVVLGVGALPLVLLGILSLRTLRATLGDTERDREIAVVEHVAEVTDRALSGVQNGVHLVGKTLLEPNIANPDAKITLARETMARVESLAQVMVYADDLSLAEGIERNEIKGAFGIPEKLTAPPLLPGTSGAFLPVEYGPRGPIVRYAEKLAPNAYGLGWVVGTVWPERLAQTVQSIAKERYNDESSLILLDVEGRVLAGPNDGPVKIGTSLRGTDVFTPWKARDGVPMRPGEISVPTLVAGQFVAANGEAMVSMVRTLPAPGWAIGVRRPERVVFQNFYRTRWVLIATASGFVLLAVLLGAWLAARTVRPLRSLGRLSRAFGRREFNRELPQEARTGDEVEDLGVQMCAMAKDIQQGELEIARRATVEDRLSRYVPAEVAREIASGARSLELGGERREISALFADVVSFTTFAERAEPEKVVAFLNELFGVLTEVVFRHEGTVDKFIGDALFAMFGAPSPMTDHAARALAAAEDMHRFVQASAPGWKEKYGVDVQLAIGVQSGEAVVGNLGSETRMEYTAIGDVVNVAARLEALARPGQTLTTQAVADAAGEGFEFNALGEHNLRGKAQAIRVLELRT